LLAQALPVSEVEDVDTFEADGRVLARDLVSELQVPPRDNSSMDGYALRCADVGAAGATLRVGQRIPAGAVADQPLAAGEAARIFTGAQLPPGADAVVMQEDCLALDDGGVRVNTVPMPGQNIRCAGEDVRLGAIVLPRGTPLNPAALGLAASIGLARLPVARRPRVALFSTGDELVMPGAVAPAQLPPGVIYNSNRFFLRALLQRLGCMVTDCGIVPDQREATIAALREAAEGHDLILSSGGVSVGEEDHVKPAVQALGSLDLWQIAIKPGKPFAYGKVRGGQGLAHFIGLPGNPVSSYVTFLLLVRPFLLRLQGMSAQALQPVSVTLPAHFEWTRGEKRREFLRARRNAAGGVDLYPQQSSGVLTSVAWGDGLVDNPPQQRIAWGDPVQFIAFAEFMA
jgi:molybdopterin molybdotransferase